MQIAVVLKNILEHIHNDAIWWKLFENSTLKNFKSFKSFNFELKIFFGQKYEFVINLESSVNFATKQPKFSIYP